MFLHQKRPKLSPKRLKQEVKLDFGANADALCGSCNAFKNGKGLTSKYVRKKILTPSESVQIIGGNGDLAYILQGEAVYSVRGGLIGFPLQETAESACFCVFRGSMVISLKELGTYYFTREKSQKVYDQWFSSMTVCADRIFGLQGDVVRYTKAGERDGWAEGEMINLPSACDALATVGGKVYALGNTCYKIAPDGEDVEFRFSVFANNIGAVAPRSVVNYNGRAVFGTKYGLYQISSDKLTPICEKLNEELDFANAQGIMYDGLYYLSCRAKNAASVGNDVTLAIDLDKEEIAGVVDVGFDSMGAIDGTIYVTLGGILARLISGVSEGKFVKTNIDFATSQKKFLDVLKVTTRKDLDVVIRSEKESRLYKIQGKKTAQKINIRDMGWEFSIELSSQEGLDVENLTLFSHTVSEV